MGAKARTALRALTDGFERWRRSVGVVPHPELAAIVLEESGYIEMWQNDRSPEAAGRLENLKELVRSMEEFENLGGFSNTSRSSWTWSRTTAARRSR